MKFLLENPDVKDPVRLLIVLVTANTGAVTAVARNDEVNEELFAEDVVVLGTTVIEPSRLLTSIIWTLVDCG